MAAATVGMPDGDDPVRPGVAPFAYVLAGALIMLFIVLVAAITVQSTPAADPSVVATTPLAGSVIAPGPFILSVTFDQPMRDRSYSFVQTSRETYPDCPGRPEMSRDGRTFTLRCHAQAGRRYELWFNRQPYMNFRSHAGIRARPYRLLFAAGAR